MGQGGQGAGGRPVCGAPHCELPAVRLLREKDVDVPERVTTRSNNESKTRRGGDGRSDATGGKGGREGGNEAGAEKERCKQAEKASGGAVRMLKTAKSRLRCSRRQQSCDDPAPARSGTARREKGAPRGSSAGTEEGAKKGHTGAQNAAAVVTVVRQFLHPFRASPLPWRLKPALRPRPCPCGGRGGRRSCCAPTAP